jgi:magnesium transporter
MLSAYAARPGGLVRLDLQRGMPLPSDALWIDLLEPTADEEKLVEATLGINVPTREEMSEIEASSRLYEDAGALFMTATIVTRLETDLPQNTQVTFILAGTRLVTNRYTDPLPFRRFLNYAQTHPATCSSPAMLLDGLLEAIINRIADVLERVGRDIDTLSAEIFSRSHQKRPAPPNFGRLLDSIGQCGELVSKARESLTSLARLLVFVQQAPEGHVSQEARGRFRTLSRDVLSMSDHADFLGDKVQFLLDATLGMVSIDQNNILKIFSVVTLFLLPPSVVVGFYGMNFEHIPWLHEPWGYWAAIVMMIGSAAVPYLLFKRRGWL